MKDKVYKAFNAWHLRIIKRTALIFIPILALWSYGLNLLMPYSDTLLIREGVLFAFLLGALASMAATFYLVAHFTHLKEEEEEVVRQDMLNFIQEKPVALTEEEQDKIKKEIEADNSRYKLKGMQAAKRGLEMLFDKDLKPDFESFKMFRAVSKNYTDGDQAWLAICKYSSLNNNPDIDRAYEIFRQWWKLHERYEIMVASDPALEAEVREERFRKSLADAAHWVVLDT